jgi:hypothetical protein
MASRTGSLGGEGSAPHVLAVDDSSVDRAVIAGILRSSHFRGEQIVPSLYAVAWLLAAGWLLLSSTKFAFRSFSACMQ